ncbi:glycine zipper 2TM domain-containing protein [Methyloraptor flagellatus]|jgi:surface antigen|uniref:17 kDa surface antigen n=1 Tax=Methyloraptor flagellatus TaxID=3162530 RepID=A0AAU7X491_9HYPH
MKSNFAVVIGFAAVLAGCADAGPKQSLGTVTGALAGGLIGSQFGGGSGKVLAAGAGAALGALLGGDIGRNLDDRDRELAAQAEYDALEAGPAGSARQWRGPSGHTGSITPGPAYAVNQYTCRDYTHTIYIDGKPQTARGTACRQPDGTWRPLS